MPDELEHLTFIVLLRPSRFRNLQYTKWISTHDMYCYIVTKPALFYSMPDELYCYILTKPMLNLDFTVCQMN